jgi:hypothetical protein
VAPEQAGTVTAAKIETACERKMVMVEGRSLTVGMAVPDTVTVSALEMERVPRKLSSDTYS